MFILELLVKAGDIVARDDNILTLETGKVALDIPTPHAGRVIEIHVTEGDTVAEGALLVTLESA
ncbi:MAG: biotin/lipoyl-containing protein [Candidatus Dechloromonas phosphoritropha]